MMLFCSRSRIFGLVLGLMLMAGQMAKTAPSKITGVSLVSPPREVAHAWTESVCQLNANWVAIQPYGFSYPNTPELRYNTNRQWWGERLDGARELIRHAHQNGLKVMLKPMVWIPGGWVGGYKLATEADWQTWEKQYETYILENAKMAAEEQVEMFCVGTEFSAAVEARPKFWRGLIQNTRKVFKGKLTYAANWDSYLQVPFWDLLDYIGIDAYFPLSDKRIPPVSELKKLWREPAKAIYDLHVKHKRPILFTEFGYRSIDACSWKQWEQEYVPNHERVNLAAQVNAYRAFFDVFWEMDWFAGMFVWQWYTHHDKAGGENNSDYTPQNKPAEELICSWFGR